MSDDGGKTWKRPLYTGLAERYPYVIKRSSRLSLWKRDTLQVEVEIRELDVSSITYPPIALRSKRQEQNLYLEIPLSELSKDSDADSIPDIEEEHLLLDPNNPDTDGDGITDGLDAMPNVARSSTVQPLDQPLSMALERIFGARFGAIIMGADVAPASRLQDMMRRITNVGEPVSRNRPIFVMGDPKDFGGFRPNQMMLVYSAADLMKVRRLTPAFHAVSLEPIVMNRVNDRGFFVWSTGWSGGACRLVKGPDGWTVDDLSEWIS